MKIDTCSCESENGRHEIAAAVAQNRGEDGMSLLPRPSSSSQRLAKVGRQSCNCRYARPGYGAATLEDSSMASIGRARPHRPRSARRRRSPTCGRVTIIAARSHGPSGGGAHLVYRVISRRVAAQLAAIVEPARGVMRMPMTAKMTVGSRV